jgi:uncharacterized membrane protein
MGPLPDGREDEMKTMVKIFSFSLWAALVGFWPGGADAQVGARGPCGLASTGVIPGLAPGGAAARIAMMKGTIECLQVTGRAPATGAPPGSGQFVTFDPPGSTSTLPSGITSNGTITGSYTDASGVSHGFLGTPGSFTTFDPPSSTSTHVTAISTNGEVAGVYCNTSCGHGFVRARDGTFTTFDSPAGSAGLSNGIRIPGGAPPDINPSGAIAGTYVGSAPSSTQHAFLRDKSGAFTTIDVPGASFTVGLAINPSGAIAGDFCGQTTCVGGFIRFPNGSFTTFDAGVVCGNVPVSINPAGAVTGLTFDPTCSLSLGYLRTPDGTVTTFGVPGATAFEPMAINPAALITGFFIDSSGVGHGFLRTLDGAITPFDVPGSSSTFATEINARGAIIGSYFDNSAKPVLHGFLRLP